MHKIAEKLTRLFYTFFFGTNFKSEKLSLKKKKKFRQYHPLPLKMWLEIDLSYPMGKKIILKYRNANEKECSYRIYISLYILSYVQHRLLDNFKQKQIAKTVFWCHMLLGILNHSFCIFYHTKRWF